MYRRLLFIPLHRLFASRLVPPDRFIMPLPVKSMPNFFTLDRADAIVFADCALHSLEQQYPYAAQHLQRHEDDLAAPHVQHPLFFGSYDWHSSVHMHWSLIRLLLLDATLPQRSAIHAHFAARFTSAHAQAELTYLQQNPGFERPYGWAWLLQLHDGLLDYARLHAPAKRWADCIGPLVLQVIAQWRSFLPLSHYPQRAGTHANSAFAMTLALRYAKKHNHSDFARALVAAAMRWFDIDKKYPAHYEPSGSDFLSPGLCEAMLMREVLGTGFVDWWQRFKPTSPAMQTWLTPAAVGSRTDGQLVHLDGLNLSRAWCLLTLAPALLQHQAAIELAAQKHLAVALPHVTGGDFVATHWLVSFALLALTAV